MSFELIKFPNLFLPNYTTESAQKGLERGRRRALEAHRAEIEGLRKQNKELWLWLTKVEAEASYWLFHFRRMEFVRKFGQAARQQLNKQRHERGRAKQPYPYV